MALISAIIISAILLLIVTNQSLTGFYGRSNILDSEMKERSSALAEACADTALLRLAANPAYAGGEKIIIDSGECTIISIDTNGSHIKTQGKFNNAYTNLRITIDTADFTVQSWEECSNLTASTAC
ncbi:hypothetical protein A2643_03915 [Candidatus Nomurabacteria bacterium RIFCSPHIGHO2_01_FULL_39_220]|nr:MAG: hypothetical protein A2643_03915 [Candidatus Nomurabacteria bacterium RIFCSPHIGHO2_01_FULL_39_220]OGI72611.1 MAG: hypothetical protein A2W56_01490 [Candidatus Nomurabacteria bacterium RIFCSPHIGHO2_02_41_18]